MHNKTVVKLDYKLYAASKYQDSESRQPGLPDSPTTTATINQGVSYCWTSDMPTFVQPLTLGARNFKISGT
jgi:hypothetical protein